MMEDLTDAQPSANRICY